MICSWIVLRPVVLPALSSLLDRGTFRYYSPFYEAIFTAKLFDLEVLLIRFTLLLTSLYLCFTFEGKILFDTQLELELDNIGLLVSFFSPKWTRVFGAPLPKKEKGELFYYFVRPSVDYILIYELWMSFLICLNLSLESLSKI